MFPNLTMARIPTNPKRFEQKQCEIVIRSLRFIFCYKEPKVKILHEQIPLTLELQVLINYYTWNARPDIGVCTAKNVLKSLLM